MNNINVRKNYNSDGITFDDRLTLNLKSENYLLTIEDDLRELIVNVESDVDSKVFVKFASNEIACNVSINVLKNAKLDFIILSDFDLSKIKYVCNVLASATLDLYLVDLSVKSTSDICINLNGDYAVCNVNTTTISNNFDENSLHITTNHKSMATQSNCVSRAVVFKNSSYINKTVGYIGKGMSYSKCHQDTKAIIFDPSASAKCDPVLLIDEYDVEASHAAAVGQIDTEELYYLQSRGLSYSECVSLLVHGFVIGVIDNVFDQAKDVLVDKINKSLIL